MKKYVVASETAALDDWEFDDDNELIAPGGKIVAEWLYAALGGQNFPPENHGDYGRSFEVSNEGRDFWLLVAGGLTREPCMSRSSGCPCST